MIAMAADALLSVSRSVELSIIFKATLMLVAIAAEHGAARSPRSCRGVPAIRRRSRIESASARLSCRHTAPPTTLCRSVERRPPIQGQQEQGSTGAKKTGGQEKGRVFSCSPVDLRGGRLSFA